MPLDGLHYKDSGLRLARRGGPMPLAIPDQQEVARETSKTLFPKNWASHLLRGGECQVVRIGKKSLNWWWLKDKEKSLRKWNKRKSMDWSENFR